MKIDRDGYYLTRMFGSILLVFFRRGDQFHNVYNCRLNPTTFDFNYVSRPTTDNIEPYIFNKGIRPHTKGFRQLI